MRISRRGSCGYLTICFGRDKTFMSVCATENKTKDGKNFLFFYYNVETDFLNKNSFVQHKPRRFKTGQIVDRKDG